MSLESQINANATTVQTQSYSMSVSELVSMYRDGELGLHPQFQRFFRWTIEQKSRLIESLLLGIPIPPIFVSEGTDSKWNVIDGLQRLSTILELMGELKDEQGNLKSPLVLTKTHYLPKLHGMQWEHSSVDSVLPDSARIKLKRARLDVNIIQSGSDDAVKFEVFQRLNTGGSAATDQEIRNCMLVMTDLRFFEWLKSLGEDASFRETIPLTDRAIDEAFDMELVARYLVFTQKTPEDLQQIDELGSYLNNEVVLQAKDRNLNRTKLKDSFDQTFKYLATHSQGNAFRRFDENKGRYLGPMMASLFEVVAVGLGNHLLSGGTLPNPNSYTSAHRRLGADLGSKTFVGSGIRASTRIPETVKFGREWIQNL